MRAIAIIAPPLLGDTIIITPHLSAFQTKGIPVYLLAPPEICELVDVCVASDTHTVALPSDFFNADVLPSDQLDQISVYIESLGVALIFDHLGNQNAFKLINNLSCQSFGVSCEAKHPYTDIISRKQLEHWQFDARSASECYADLYALANIQLALDAPKLRVTVPTNRIGTSILINPGAGSQTKRWPLDNFIEVAERLAVDCSYQITFLIGPKESDLLPLVRSKTNFTIYDGTPVSLTGLTEFVASHHVLLTNDTAVMHLGAACGVPTAAIFTGGLHQPAKWFPYGFDRNAVFVGDQISAPNQPPDPLWIKNISCSEIITATQRLLRPIEIMDLERA